MKKKFLLYIGIGAGGILFLLIAIIAIALLIINDNNNYYATSEGNFTCSMSMPISYIDSENNYITKQSEIVDYMKANYAYEDNNYCYGTAQDINRNGIDLFGNNTTKIISISDGTLEEIIDYTSNPTDIRASGYKITIKHITEGDTFYSVYDGFATLSLPEIIVGTAISKDALLGFVSTGENASFIFMIMDSDKNYIDVNKFFNFTDGNAKCTISEKTFTDLCIYSLGIENDLEFLCAITAPIKAMTSSNVTEFYGYRPYLSSTHGYFHPAIDIDSSDKNVRAILGGKVIETKNDGVVTIDHNNGYYSQYLHLETFNVSKGDIVEQGHILGIMGNKGCPGCGVHLDLRIYKTEYVKSECNYIYGNKCYINLNYYFGYSDGEKNSENIYPCVVQNKKLFAFINVSTLKQFLIDYHCNCASDNIMAGNKNFKSDRLISSMEGFKENYCNGEFSDVDSSSHLNINTDDADILEYEKRFSYQKKYKPQNIKRYISYMKKNPSLSYADIVIRVNIGLDMNFYENTKLAETVNNQYLMLVNKYSYLPTDYDDKISTDLQEISDQYFIGSNYSVRKLRKIAKSAFEKMSIASIENGTPVYGQSAYREYSMQEKLYDNCLKTNSKELCDSDTARPGFSEHQTGLAIDVSSTKGGNMLNFENTESYNWMKANAHKYGFILRYPEGKEDITGFRYESWHYRYVGISAATKIYNENITFDEYYYKYVDRT